MDRVNYEEFLNEPIEIVEKKENLTEIKFLPCKFSCGGGGGGGTGAGSIAIGTGRRLFLELR